MAGDKKAEKVTPQIHIYTDGSSRGNPGPGGFGTVLISGPYRKVISGGFCCTTNNRMELLAVIVGLEALKVEGSEVVVTSDSRYVVDAVQKKWVFDWERKGFQGKKNPDLWIRFLKVYRRHKVRLEWIRGHNGHPENEECDRMAVAASHRPHLAVDIGYNPDEPA